MYPHIGRQQTEGPIYKFGFHLKAPQCSSNIEFIKQHKIVKLLPTHCNDKFMHF